MTEYVCIPNSQYKGPGFGGGPGSNCTLVDARVVYAEMYRARTLLRGPGEITAYLADSIVGAGVNSFIANIASKEAFAKYATDFEKNYSALTKPKRPWGYVSAYPEYRADPVIDKERLIVGHFGWFPGDSIWVANSAPRTRGQGELYIELGLQDIVDSGAPVCIGRRNSDSYSSNLHEGCHQGVTRQAFAQGHYPWPASGRQGRRIQSAGLPLRTGQRRARRCHLPCEGHQIQSPGYGQANGRRGDRAPRPPRNDHAYRRDRAQ